MLEDSNGLMRVHRSLEMMLIYRALYRRILGLSRLGSISSAKAVSRPQIAVASARRADEQKHDFDRVQGYAVLTPL